MSGENKCLMCGKEIGSNKIVCWHCLVKEKRRLEKEE